MSAELEEVRRLATDVARQVGLPPQVEISVIRATPEQSKAAQKSVAFNAETQGLIQSGAIVEPPYPLGDLALKPLFSSILPQCISARATHIAGWGIRFEPRFDTKAMAADDPDFLAKVAHPERQTLRRHVEGFGGAEGIEALLDKVQRDIDTVGHSGVELIRDVKGESLVDLEHVAGRTLLLGVKDTEPTLVNRPRISADGSAWEDCWRWERLRPVVQIDGTRKVWFSPPGDWRARDIATGRVIKLRDGTVVERDPTDPTHARELLLFQGEYNPNSPYSLPPWAGTISAILKSELIESIGIAYFESGGVPPFIITLYGASVSADSTKRFKEQIEERKGPDSRFKALVVQAVPDSAGGASRSNVDPSAMTTPKIGVTELGASMGDEALYDEGDRYSRSKVRSACGLAPIHVGESDDYTRATAQASMEWAEGATFGPGRKRLERRFNSVVLPELGAVHWLLRLKSPDLSNAEDIERIVNSGLRALVGTPNDYLPVLERALGADLTSTDEVWGNVPPELTKILMQGGRLNLDSDGNGVIDVSSDGEVERFVRDASAHHRLRLAAGVARIRDALFEAE
ncbi:MAG: hypothetical protein AB7U23_13155 [Dehalococcoidia bacterium]